MECCEKLESIAYGEDGKSPDPTKCQKLGKALIETNAIKRLIVSISDLDFEARKSVSKIFSTMVTNDYSEFRTKYLLAAQNRDVLDFLVRSYSKSSEIVLVCGEMLRVCLQHDAIVKVVLTQETLNLFFKEYLHRKNFTIQSDALSTYFFGGKTRRTANSNSFNRYDENARGERLHCNISGRREES